MKTSNSISNLAGALVKFQASPFAKDANNTFHKSKYVTLDTLIEAVRPHLDEVGLSISSWLDSDGGIPGLSTLLVHVESGEWVSSFFPYSHMDQFKGSSPAQAAGIWTTYTRRYSLSAVLNLPGEKDDDGGSEGQAAASKKKGDQPAASTKYPWRADLAHVRTLEDINRLYKAHAALVGRESDDHAVLVDDCANAKANL